MNASQVPSNPQELDTNKLSLPDPTKKEEEKRNINPESIDAGDTTLTNASFPLSNAPPAPPTSQEKVCK